MLYVIWKRNHSELEYLGGQGPIVHLEADLHRVVEWARINSRRWAFTTANASTSYFDDYADLSHLNKIDWDAVSARWWPDPPVKESKQAEFLLEYSLPWELVDRIAISTNNLYNVIQNALGGGQHRPAVVVKPGWYY